MKEQQAGLTGGFIGFALVIAGTEPEEALSVAQRFSAEFGKRPMSNENFLEAAHWLRQALEGGNIPQG